MRKRVLLTVILAAALLSGCSEDVVVPYGPAPTPRGPLALAAPDNGRLRARDWPRACDLLTEADIRAILPSTTRVSSTSEDGKFISTGGEAPYNFVVPDARCGYEVFFPGTYDPSRGASVFAEVHFAGSPELARQNWDKFVADPGNLQCTADFPGLGADACLRDRLTKYFTVRKKGVIVQIGSHDPNLAQGTRLAGQSAEDAAASAWNATRVWEAEVTPLFVRPVLARLP
ncbi:hypothetical protein [Planobispora rosea]|uniref:hypothetical protein n=1 Tax=Planobispora rosea TaxID=35762 RepID=UPI00166FE950|nr:hypothetical protein [Planobispora rosea]